MSRALVPVHAGVLSALGMLAAPRGRQLSRTLTGPLSALGAERVEQVLAALADSGRRALSAEGWPWPSSGPIPRWICATRGRPTP